VPKGLLCDMPRQHKRFSFPLEIVLDFSSGRREARISDLSLSGCFVDILLSVSVGEHVSFRLRSPSGYWVDLTGEVVYCMPSFGFGIRFTNMNEVKQQMLEQIILARGGQPWDPPE
jgi:hypothetical protein